MPNPAPAEPVVVAHVAPPATRRARRTPGVAPKSFATASTRPVAVGSSVREAPDWPPAALLTLTVGPTVTLPSAATATAAAARSRSPSAEMALSAHAVCRTPARKSKPIEEPNPKADPPVEVPALIRKSEVLWAAAAPLRDEQATKNAAANSHAECLLRSCMPPPRVGTCGYTG